MHLPNGEFQLDFSELFWESRDGVSNAEIETAFGEPGVEFYSICDPETAERYYYCIGFSSKARFLFILLKDHRDDFVRLIVSKVKIAKDESQIRECYYSPKFKER